MRERVKEAPQNGRLNQSVRKAIAILRAAGADASGETASELARTAGLPWATAVRFIRTLEAEGFLFRLPESDRYVLGFGLILLARAGDQGRVLAAMARPTLDRLAHDVGETVNLTVVGPDGGLEIVEQIDPPRVVRTGDWGGPYPLHATSIGKLLLATYDDARLAEFLSGELAHYARSTISEPEALREELARVRANGYSTAVDELEDGLAALSVGVRDAAGALVALVTVSGPTFRFDERARRAALAPLRQATEATARLLG